MKIFSCLFIYIILFFTFFQNASYFPESFLKGVAFSSFQNGGSCWGYNNWDYFSAKKNRWGRPTIRGDISCGVSAGFWQKAHEDIALLKEMHCNSVRFSVEWAEIEPHKGVINEAALDFYEHYCKALCAAGIQPTITLYHWVHPFWFEQLGAFEKEENISYFVDFCSRVFKRLSPYVSVWYTLNEPTVVSFMGYILGMHAPGNILSFQKAGIVLKNQLIAHVQVYQTLKNLPNGSKSEIGLVHQVLKAQAYSSYHVMGRILAKCLNTISAHHIVKKFLKTGFYHYKIPGLIDIQHYDANAKKSYDFIGINYYSRVVVGFGPTCYPDEEMTDMEYASYPRGIYEAIQDCSELNVPIYITENGIPDAQDTQRAQFINDYLLYVKKAIEDGYDVRGYFYWTLMDNFEWDRGFSIKFGLYDVDFSTLKRTLRSGSLALQKFYKG